MTILNTVRTAYIIQIDIVHVIIDDYLQMHVIHDMQRHVTSMQLLEISTNFGYR